MYLILIGNALAFIGAILMVAIGFLKKRNQILITQSIQFSIMGAANIILGGITGGLANFVSIVRNIICIKFEFKIYLKIIFTGLLVFLCLLTNNSGWLGILPLLSAVIYTWFLDVKNETQLKIILITTQIFWVVYDISIHNYVSFAFDIFTIISNIIGIFMIKKSAA